ncbi:SDR family oxidoreductase [Paenibacillus sp. BC26]|uniref:SDR family oxidoreductase n=1 Tax=Paenibacillus sp. BC26 TaxID=1881032 RepID=UPI0008E196B8|nr:SDR family oxidoreductase [Paenibacillus sp. BC26]SFT26497.1 NAD(P)-dependent dehydrogenase, short-chain alcohol dehydrogenase family [Paenibacillus sp. BC26]
MNILLTGASRGLGLAIAAEALERRHNVIAGVRDVSGDKLATLRATYGDRLTIAELDVASEESIAGLASALKREGRTLGAIVNNAAILNARNTQIEELDMNDVVQAFEVNLYGPMRVVKHFLPLLTEPNGALLNISSEAGSITNAYPGDYPYSISKTALNMFSQQLHRYVNKRQIQVLSIHPGWMKTDMGGENAPTDPHASARGIVDLLERRIDLEELRFQFVDYSGKEMPI